MKTFLSSTSVTKIAIYQTHVLCFLDMSKLYFVGFLVLKCSQSTNSRQWNVTGNDVCTISHAVPFPPAKCWFPGHLEGNLLKIPWIPKWLWKRSPTLLAYENYNCIIVYLFGGWFVNSIVNISSPSSLFIYSLFNTHLTTFQTLGKSTGK